MIHPIISAIHAMIESKWDGGWRMNGAISPNDIIERAGILNKIRCAHIRLSGRSMRLSLIEFPPPKMRQQPHVQNIPTVDLDSGGGRLRANHLHHLPILLTMDSN